MDVMYWTIQDRAGKWRLGEDCCLTNGLINVPVRWDTTGGGTPVPYVMETGEACTRWREGLVVQEGVVAGAKKYDDDKPMMDLLTQGCPEALLEVGKVLTYGYKKYGGKHGWKSLPDAITRYEAAMLRHQLALASGEQLDPESGMRHSAHIACNALFLLQFDMEKDKCSK